MGALYNTKAARDQWTTVGLLPRFIELIAQNNMSHSDIAKVLCKEFDVCLTRNAVIGKVHRMKLSKPCHPGFKPGPKPKPRPAKAAPLPRRVFRKQPVMRTPVARKPYRVTEYPPEQALDASNAGVAMLDLEDDMCKWPLDNGASCGAKQWKRGRPYCAGHERKSMRKCEGA